MFEENPYPRQIVLYIYEKMGFINRLDKNADNRTIVWKTETHSSPTVECTIPILKMDEVKRIAYGIAFAPDNVEDQGDIITDKEIEKWRTDLSKPEAPSTRWINSTIMTPSKNALLKD